MSGGNNNVGQNTVPAKLKGNIHFDLAPTAGTDAFAGKTGQLYDDAAIKAIIVARGATFSDGATAFAATDDLVGLEADLKPVAGEGFNEGDSAQLVTSTTSDASYQNNGSWTNIDTGGGREDGLDRVGIEVSTFQSLFVENGSILTVHTVFQQA